MKYAFGRGGKSLPPSVKRSSSTPKDKSSFQQCCCMYTEHKREPEMVFVMCIIRTANAQAAKPGGELPLTFIWWRKKRKKKASPLNACEFSVADFIITSSSL